MLIVDSYAVAVGLCFITMLCWGSWANTLKLGVEGVAVPALLLGLRDRPGADVAGARLHARQHGRRRAASFLPDLQQASGRAIGYAVLGGVIFNLSNLLIVAATDIAGMAVAFPVAVGLALVIGVVLNYLKAPVGNPVLLFGGVALVVAAILVNARAYARLPSSRGGSAKGLGLSVLSGVLMSVFYRFVAESMIGSFRVPEAGQLTPFSAMFVFTSAILLSNFLWNTYFMYRPVSGSPTSYGEYATQGHAVAARRRDPGRAHLVLRHDDEPDRLRAGGLRDQLRAGPGRDDGGRGVGRLRVEGVQGRARGDGRDDRGHVRAVHHGARDDHRGAARLTRGQREAA